MVRAEIHWDRIRSGVWQLPAAMMVAGLLLFRALLSLDAGAVGAALPLVRWLQWGTGDDARNLLSVLVSAMMTMATLVFSMTIVSLSVAASQFGSRLVRSCVRDTKTKVTLGIFAMTIIYLLLALRVVSGDMQASAVPHATVTVGLVLSVICVIAMVVLVHMVAHAIVVDEVIRRVGADLEESLAGMPARLRHSCRCSGGSARGVSGMHARAGRGRGRLCGGHPLRTPAEGCGGRRPLHPPGRDGRRLRGQGRPHRQLPRAPCGLRPRRAAGRVGAGRRRTNAGAGPRLLDPPPGGRGAARAPHDLAAVESALARTRRAFEAELKQLP